MTMIGPWVSEPLTSDVLGGVVAYNDVAWANELLGPMFVGMVEAAAGTGVTVVDGGELYSPRAADQFEAFYQWMKHGFAAQSPLVPEALRATYSGTVSVGFMVYDDAWLGAPMDANSWQSTLRHALERTDRYVVAYTELHDWLGVGWPTTGLVPAEWRQATAAARLG
jgi:hypothetical protein